MSDDYKSVGQTVADMQKANDTKWGNNPHEGMAQDAASFKELKVGQQMHFNGRSVHGEVEGSMPVTVVNPHSNAHLATHTKGGREYEGAFSHIRTATVERPPIHGTPARQFEAHHFTLSERK